MCVGGGALEAGQKLSDKGYQHYQVSNRGRTMILQAVLILLSYCFGFQLNLGWLRGVHADPMKWYLLHFEDEFFIFSPPSASLSSGVRQNRTIK